MCGRASRYEKCRNCRRIAERLIEIPNDVVDEIDNVAVQDVFVMIGGELLRDGPRIRKLIERRFFKPDRECFHPTVRVPDHVRDNGARIDAAAQERAHGHIANHMHADRLVDLFPQLLDEGVLIRAPIGLEGDIPIARDAHWTLRPDGRNVCRFQLVNAANDAL